MTPASIQKAKGPAEAATSPDRGSNYPHKEIQNVHSDTTAGEACAMPEASPILITVNPHDRLQLATTIEKLINILDDLEPDLDAEPGTWIEQVTCREHDTVADQDLEEQHDREWDPADDGLADSDAMHSEEFSIAYLGFRGDGRREAEALLATHQLASGEALRFPCGADIPVAYSVQVVA